VFCLLCLLPADEHRFPSGFASLIRSHILGSRGTTNFPASSTVLFKKGEDLRGKFLLHVYTILDPLTKYKRGIRIDMR